MPKSANARWVLGASLLVGLVLRLRTVFTDDGIYWPDEIYQSFEPAHRLVFGYGVVAWEFIEGARNWAFAGFVAFLLKLCAIVGADTPGAYVHFVKVVFAVGAVGSGWAVYRLALTASGNFRDTPQAELTAACGGALWSLCAASLYFSTRAMSENGSAICVVFGLALALDAKSSVRQVLLGTSLLGLATLFRLQTAVFCVSLAVVMVVRWLRVTKTGGAEAARAKQTLLQVMVTLTAWALAYGTLDAITWHDAPKVQYGGFFHSAVVYVRFNLIEHRGDAWGTAPWQYYADVLFRSMPMVALVLGFGAIVAVRRAPSLVAMVVAFLVVHAAVGHKEYRFLMPVLPVACALVGVALLSMWRVPVLRLGVLGVLFAAVTSALAASSLTMGDLGAYADRPQSTAWNDFGNVNRLMMVAGAREDLCGLRIDVAHPAWTGGTTYLHKNVPLYPPGYPEQSRHFNYAIVWAGRGGEVIAQDHGIELVRLPGMGSCTPDPAYSWRLP